MDAETYIELQKMWNSIDYITKALQDKGIIEKKAEVKKENGTNA